jgi:D-alanyl-D-alanine dipeptidase
VQGLPRLFVLREGLIKPFLAAARELNDRGWVMRVEDGLRTPTMQKLLARQDYTFDLVLDRVLWELDGRPLTPEFMARRLDVLIAASAKIGTHMSASAIDISVLDRGTGQEVERGGPYLEMSELTPMATPFVSGLARANRESITAVMQRHGFMAYPWEFWHYNSGDAHVEVLNGRAAPGRYGPVAVDLVTGAVTPMENPTARLNTLEEIQAATEAALARRAG